MIRLLFLVLARARRFTSQYSSAWCGVQFPATVTSVVAIVVLLTASPLLSQGITTRIEGVVTDSTGRPVPQVTIRFTGDAHTFYAYTDTAGRYGLTLPSGISDYLGVAEETPTMFILGQNFPNPFNPQTTIPVTLEQRSSVRLEVFSILGQRVRTLVNETLDGGSHLFAWDGRDDSGRGVAAGVYFYRLEAWGRMESRKMLLMDGSFSGGGTGAPVRKIAQTHSYDIYTTKGTMQTFQGSVDVNDDQAVKTYNVVLPDTYRPYKLGFGSSHFASEFFYPGETIWVNLVSAHEKYVPVHSSLTVTSAVGDSESVTTSDFVWYLPPQVPCPNYELEPVRSYKAAIPTATGTVVRGNGILEVAIGDTVGARWDGGSGFSELASIAAIDTVEQVELWGRTYASRNGKGYIVLPDGSWYSTETGHVDIVFATSATESEIAAFLDATPVVSYRIFYNSYFVDLEGSTNPVEFMRSNGDNPIIDSMGLIGVGCVL